VSDRSIYQVDSVWTTDEGRSLKLSSLQGRTQVVVMFFANCQSACPLLVHDMKRIEQALPADLRDRVGFTLVTFDPDRDTVESLHAYRSRNQLDRQHWTLLRGKPDDIQELAVLLGIKYKKDAQGQFAHSNLITVLNRAGEIVHQQFGLAQAPDATVLAIQGADQEK
jgi:protein SCO1/2